MNIIQSLKRLKISDRVYLEGLLAKYTELLYINGENNTKGLCYYIEQDMKYNFFLSLLDCNYTNYVAVIDLLIDKYMAANFLGYENEMSIKYLDFKQSVLFPQPFTKDFKFCIVFHLELENTTIEFKAKASPKDETLNKLSFELLEKPENLDIKYFDVLVDSYFLQVFNRMYERLLQI